MAGDNSNKILELFQNLLSNITTSKTPKTHRLSQTCIAIIVTSLQALKMRPQRRMEKENPLIYLLKPTGYLI